MNETKVLDIVDVLKMENRELMVELEGTHEKMQQKTEELAVLRREMKQIIGELEELTSSSFIDNVAEQIGEDFEGAFMATDSDRDRKLFELKGMLWGMMKIIVDYRTALGMDYPDIG